MKTDGKGEYNDITERTFVLVNDEVVRIDSTTQTTTLTKFFETVELHSIAFTAQASAIDSTFLLMADQSVKDQTEGNALGQVVANTRTVERYVIDKNQIFLYTTHLGTAGTNFYVNVELVYRCRDMKAIPGIGFRLNKKNSKVANELLTNSMLKKIENGVSMAEFEKILNDQQNFEDCLKKFREKLFATVLERKFDKNKKPDSQ